MRRLLAILVIVLVGACGSSSPPTGPAAPPVPTSEPANSVGAAPPPPTCADAAFGIDAASKDLRPAEQEVVPALRAKCQADSWSEAAIACFAKLTANDDILACSEHLTPDARAALLAEIGGGVPDSTAQLAELAEVKQKLAAVSVGIATCDELVQEVARLMDCEGLTLAHRILLGSETADTWAISTARLTIPDKARMGTACGKSLDELHKHAAKQSC